MHDEVRIRVDHLIVELCHLLVCLLLSLRFLWPNSFRSDKVSGMRFENHNRLMVLWVEVGAHFSSVLGLDDNGLEVSFLGFEVVSCLAGESVPSGVQTLSQVSGANHKTLCLHEALVVHVALILLSFFISQHFVDRGTLDLILTGHSVHRIVVASNSLGLVVVLCDGLLEVDWLP